MENQQLQKEQIVSVLIDLASSINKSIKISDYKFDAFSEIEGLDEFTEEIFKPKKASGWKTVALKIRWNNKITK